jgi:hypothetical protein
MHFTTRLAGRQDGRLIAFGIDITDPLAEAASAEFVSTAEVVDGIVGAERGDAGLHGTEMLVAEWEKVGPHGKREDSTIRGSRSDGGSLRRHQAEEGDADQAQCQRSDQQVHAFADIVTRLERHHRGVGDA